MTLKAAKMLLSGEMHTQATYSNDGLVPLNDKAGGLVPLNDKAGGLVP